MRSRTIWSLSSVVALICSGPAVAADPPDDLPIRIGTAVHQGVSPPLRDLTPKPPRPMPPRQVPNQLDFLPRPARSTSSVPDPVRQTDTGSTTVAGAATPAPLLSFEGTNDADNAAVAGGHIVPPDAEGDVGPNHYVQMNNLVLEIFDKTGNSVLGPIPNNQIWSGLPAGSHCREHNDGDPIALYDQGVDRWVLSQFSFFEGIQCVAVSQTGDPTGAYYLYEFTISPGCLNDYPKLGVWNDAYYLTANEFCFVGQLIFRAAIAVAFEKNAMINGQAADFAVFDIFSPNSIPMGVQPAHWEGPTPPPPGRPNVFVDIFDADFYGHDETVSDAYHLWEFDVDWEGGNHSFTHVGQAETADFDLRLCDLQPCVPQPDGGELLDTLTRFTMYRAHYRNFGDHETLIVNHTVNADGNDTAGVRWAELRHAGSGWTVHQTGTYAPADGNHRWMGSANMDGDGNIAVAYSVSSETTFPSIRYNTRKPGDPLGQLTGGEQECMVGTGSQVASSNRWGDYSTASVDPVDDCTFWITNEYYFATASFDFRTRICAFRIDGCGTPRPAATVPAKPARLRAPAPWTAARRSLPRPASATTGWTTIATA